MPKFTLERPPVMEVVLGGQFDPIPRLSAGHLGAFWKELGEDWPIVNDAPLLPPQFERFGDDRLLAAFGQLQVRFSTQPEVRLQIRNRAEDRMIQVQNGRLHYNWLGEAGGPYPSYGQVKQEFDSILDRFRGFLASVSLDAIRPNQWELTYVDHIPKGAAWSGPEDWNTLFRNWKVEPVRQSSVQLGGFDTEWHYEIVPQRGRLHIKLTTGRREKPTAEELLIVNMTARGPVESTQEGGDNWSECLDLGHDTVLAAFREFTSDSLQQYWGVRP